MSDIFKYAGQFLFFAIVAIFVGYFSSNPRFSLMPEGTAQIKLSFAHGAARKIDCRKLSSKEIAKLPANERRPNTCERERIPLHIQLIVDGKMLYDELLQPTGIAKDGPARTYKKFIVSTGSHQIIARLRDTKRANGFDYETSRNVVLDPFQNLAIDFKADVDGFLFF